MKELVHIKTRGSGRCCICEGPVTSKYLKEWMCFSCWFELKEEREEMREEDNNKEES